MSFNSNRLPYMISIALGCLALCLVVGLAGGVLLFFVKPGAPSNQAENIPGSPAAASQPTPGSTSATSQSRVLPTPSPLNATTVNLDTLTFYQATLQLHAQGTRAGRPFEESYTITRALRTEPALEVVQIDTIGLGQAGEYSGTVFIRSGKQFFARWSAEDPCISVLENQAVGLYLMPGSLLPNLANAQISGNDSVAGVAAQRYEISSTDTGVTGKVWLATEGRVVKASVRQEGALPALGADVKGHAEWEYALSNIDQPVSFDLPSSCGRLLGDFPMPGDAADLSATDEVVRYRTSISVNDLANFYADKMKQAGWESLGTPTIAKDDARIGFTRDEATVFVGAVLRDNMVDVTIVFQDR